MNNSFVFHRRPDRELPLAIHAEGVWITNESGKRYLDASGGASASMWVWAVVGA